MSDFGDADVERAQKVLAEIKGIHGEADDLNRSVARAVSDFTKMVVRNAGMISDAILVLDDDDRIKRLSDHLRCAASENAEYLSFVEMLHVEANWIATRLGKLEESFCGLWNETFRRAVNVQNELREARDRALEHAINDPAVRERVWSITGGTCWYCDVDLVKDKTTEERHRVFCVDHLVPKVHGGPDHLSNYVPACSRCNSQKSAKSYVEFRRWKADRSNLTVIDGGADGEAA